MGFLKTPGPDGIKTSWTVPSPKNIDFYRRVADKGWILARGSQLGFYRRLLPELRPGD